jgi:hypothetical protein
MTEFLQSIVEWLVAPLSGALQRENPPYFVAHALLTTFALGFLMPMGIVLARYFKITKKQDWPRQLDSKFWWQSHLFFSYTAMCCLLIGIVLLWPWLKGFDLRDLRQLSLLRLVHVIVGWALVFLSIFIVITGWLRGTKGGPTDKQMRGDHYDLSPRRLWFEATHKKASYFAFVLMVCSRIATVDAYCARFFLACLGISRCKVRAQRSANSYLPSHLGPKNRAPRQSEALPKRSTLLVWIGQPQPYRLA